MCKTPSYSEQASALVLAALLGVGLFATGTQAAHAEKLTLTESIDIALENNPTVHIARENMRKAAAVIDEATALGMPKLSLDGTYERVDEVPVAQFGDRTVELGRLESRTADLALVQPIDIFGVVKTGRKAAKFSKSSARYEFDQATNDVTLETKEAFYNVLRAQEFLKVEEDTIAQLEAHLKDAQLHYAAGTAAKFDVLRAETQLANARQGLITAQNGVELAKAAFNNVLGRPLDISVELVEPQRPQFVDLNLQSCIESASRWRPELLRADSLVSMSDTMTKVIRLSSKPRFNFRWAYNRNFDVSIFNPRDSSWRAFFTTSFSIYDGGAARASVDKAASDANNARSAREQVVQGVTLDAKQSYLSLKESRERILAAEKGLEQAKESMRLAQVRYGGGVAIQIEVFDAQAALTLAQTNHVNALYDYQVALARLERAVGGEEQLAELIGGQPVAGSHPPAAGG